MTAERRNQERMERTVRIRRRVLLGGWVLASLVVVGRSAQIQVAQGDTWAAMAEDQHQSSEPIVAPRGRILDRDGLELALSREIYRIGFAPHEIDQLDEVVSRVSRLTGIEPATVREWATDEDRRWRQLPGKYSPRAREALRGLDGVYPLRELERFYPHGDLAMGVLGRVMDGEGRGGIEQRYEDLLSGVPGRKIYARDNNGRPLPGEALVVEQPRRGGDVVLTLDLDLQEIGEEIIAQAVAENEAVGGDLLITDPRTGDILAMASVREGNTAALSAINTPYEPGSTLKPITVAGLLDRGLASLDDSVDVENGSWTINGRTLDDVGKDEGLIPVRRALQVSSNVGVAKVAQAYEPAQQFQNLRDFGFGTPTGLGLPGEVAGMLRHPDDWSLQSPASLAIGYEIGVTPLQMAMAYGALANGGQLMQPRLVREIERAREGRTEHLEPRAIRRVLAPEVTRQINEVLVDVVEDGTGTRARLSTFSVAGKSGTARAWTEGGYREGEYFASFVGFFPAEDPQLVVLVKLDRPHAEGYYGGALAAPVTKATMEAILAIRQAPLDRRALAHMARGTRTEVAADELLAVPAAFDAVARPGPEARFAAFDPGVPPSSTPSADAEEAAALAAGATLVPDVSGLAPRLAVRRLHARGLRVRLEYGGDEVGTVPAAGTRLAPGDTVRLRTGRRSDG